MIFTSASRLAVACIIGIFYLLYVVIIFNNFQATRYSCVRKQGFLETSNTAFKVLLLFFYYKFILINYLV